MSPSERKESPLFVKTRDFMVWLFGHTSRFPRQYRHTLTERTERAMIEFQRCLGAAALLKQRDALDRAELELWQARQLLRMAHDVGVFPARQLEFATAALAEIGKLLGAWKRKAAEA
jgi:galactokinase